MTEERESCGSGRLVSLSHWLPSEPFDIGYSFLAFVAGCNHLKCNYCHEQVRWIDGVAVPAGQRRTAQDFAGVADPVAAGLLEPSSTCRLYLCACSIRAVYGQESTDNDYGLDPRATSDGPWRCAGHPRLALPHVIDGVEVSATTDLDALVAGYFAGTVPEKPPFGETSAAEARGAWLFRLYRVVPDASFRDELTLALSRYVAAHAREPAVVEIAGVFFRDYSGVPGAEVIVDLALEAIAARDRSLLMDVEGALNLMADSRDRAVAKRALDACKTGLLSGMVGLTFAVAEYDSTWLQEHATEIAAAMPRDDWWDVPFYVRKQLDGRGLATLLASCAQAAGVGRAGYLERADYFGNQSSLSRAFAMEAADAFWPTGETA